MEPTGPQVHAQPGGAARRRFSRALAAVLTLVVTALAAAGPSGRPAGAAVDCSDRYYSPDLATRVVKPMTYPVIGGGTRLRNYGDDRGDHIHAGEDILGKKLQKLVAVTSGTVVRVKYATDGNYVYIQGDDGWIYGYLHINNDTPGTDDGKNPAQWAFGPGIVVGARVSRGQLVAYMGDSGNAESVGAMVHFEIRKPNCKWYWAQAVDPAPSLDAATVPTDRVPADTFRPWTAPDPLVKRQYADFLGRPVSSSSLTSWRDKLDSGDLTPEQFVAAVVAGSEAQSRNGALVRLYKAVFLRLPDHTGYQYWLGKVRSGMSLRDVAEVFASSGEFRSRYGALSNGDYVDLVYQNVLGRAPDAGGRAYWIGQLQSGLTRGGLMVQFSESTENKARTATTAGIVVVHDAMLGRMISDDSEATWRWKVAAGSATIESLVRQLRYSDEYAARVGA
ncbi:MAG: DUF4214 domain-containing protein [Actinobacteria bacterium]|nr:DUF4214 domain-containing protein [Actinomycetota bacterium]